MSVAGLARLHLPVFTEAFTCLCTKGRWLSTTTRFDSNKDYKVSPTFLNRNPRNLERKGLVPRDKGWKYQYPKRDFYHRLDLDIDEDSFTATVTHCSGKEIICLSSTDEYIAKHFSKPNRVESYEIYGHLLAQKLVDSGLTSVFYDSDGLYQKSTKHAKLIEALEEYGIELKEPEYKPPRFTGGIDYDKPNRYAERKKWKDDFQIA